MAHSHGAVRCVSAALEVRKSEVLRLLGVLPDRRQPNWFGHVLERTLQECRTLIAPRAVYTFVKATGHGGHLVQLASGMVLPVGPSSCGWERVEQVAIGICTIGPDLEHRVSGLLKEGQLLAAYVMDAYGSAAVESLANHVRRQIAFHATRKGMQATAPLSPGSGHLSIELQEDAVQTVAAGRVGVELTGSLMMVLGKSVSFFVGIGRNVAGAYREDLCSGCSMKDCQFRRKRGHRGNC